MKKQPLPKPPKGYYLIRTPSEHHKARPKQETDLHWCNSDGTWNPVNILSGFIEGKIYARKGKVNK